MKPLLIAMHGWGFEASFWASLMPKLDRFEHYVVDLGYFGTPAPPKDVGDRPVVAIGHSAGVSWLLRHLKSQQFGALIAINGFARYVAEPNSAPGIPPRVIQRMVKRFVEEPEAVLHDFYQRCGGGDTVPPGRMDVDLLRLGLQSLAADDLRPELARLTCPILSLAARDDTIVPAEMATHAFDAAPDHRLVWREAGGHLLPLTAPDWCAAEIEDFLSQVAA